MTHDEFIGDVQARARLASRGDAEKVTRVTLEVLGDRLIGGMPGNLAAQLPEEIGRHLEVQEGSDRSADFGLGGFFDRIAAETGADEADAVHQARAVISVVSDAVGDGQISKVRNQLPPDFSPLFESGSEGSLN